MAFAPPLYSYGHSRDSSAASNMSSPVTPTFSTRSHSRWPSSSSSLATSPDSPSNNGPKTTLEDLVEESAEREDGFSTFETGGLGEEPLCICELSNCIVISKTDLSRRHAFLRAPPGQNFVNHAFPIGTSRVDTR